MLDRQHFEKQVFPNGITLYTQKFSSPICCLQFIFPVGAGHSHPDNGLLPGSAHFLEHAQMIRSSHYPEAYSLDRQLGLKGGHSNATTCPETTHYELDVPAEHLSFAIEALLDRTFHPLFNEDDLVPERTVVMNERNQRKFYPGRNAVSQYYHQTFMEDAEYSLEQLFGSDQDLVNLTAETLLAMQEKISRSNELIVIAVGPDSFEQLASYLATRTTAPTGFSLHMSTATWKNPSFQQVFFDIISQPTLDVAWIQPRLPYAEFRALSFILSLLTNSTHGALYQEFREEKGWTYAIEHYRQQRREQTIFGISVSLNSIDQVNYVQEALPDRIYQAIHNQDLVEAEIARYMSSQVYNYQTAYDIIGSASDDLTTYGRIYSEEEWREAVRNLADPAWREYIVNKYFQASDMGSICFMPERREKIPVRTLATSQ